VPIAEGVGAPVADGVDDMRGVLSCAIATRAIAAPSAAMMMRFLYFMNASRQANAARVPRIEKTLEVALRAARNRIAFPAGSGFRFLQDADDLLLGKPNAFVESFNGKFRLECLNAHWFSTLDDARRTIEDWRTDYNDIRPHSSLGEMPPSVFAAAHRGTAA